MCKQFLDIKFRLLIIGNWKLSEFIDLAILTVTENFSWFSLTVVQVERHDAILIHVLSIFISNARETNYFLQLKRITYKWEKQRPCYK